MFSKMEDLMETRGDKRIKLWLLYFLFLAKFRTFYISPIYCLFLNFIHVRKQTWYWMIAN
jgi:hypothetical protein